MTASLPEPDDARPVTTGEELAELLSAQHADLREAWSRVPQLHGCAREDVFLHARRLLAVHVVLERVVLGPRLGDVEGDRGPRGTCRPTSTGTWSRPSARPARTTTGRSRPTSRRRARASPRRSRGTPRPTEQVRLTGPLPEADRQCVGSAVALWDGAGDAYLGNTWAEMVEVALAQVSPEG